MASDRIPLHTLTQTRLNILTRAFPSAKQVLAYPQTAELRHVFTLEFNPREKRLIDAAARECGVRPERFMYNAISGLAEGVLGEPRAKRLLARRKRS